LLGGLPRAVDGLARALTQCPMVVDLGEAEVHEGEPPEASDHFVGRDRACEQVFEQLVQRGFVHRDQYPAPVDPRATPLTARRDEGPLSVAFLGPAGTFTEEALKTQPDLLDGSVAKSTFSEVIDAVASGETDVGFLPIENSIEGTVSATLDSLVFEAELLIQREVVLDIHLNLAAPPGTQLSSIRRVLSFPHASAQCRGFLADRLPGVELVATNSTAEAARIVGEERRPHMAALAPRLAAELYGLEVLEAAIEDHPDNQTRFVLVAREGVPGQSGHDKTSIVCFQREDHPGTLHAILSEFSARSINLSKLESRPTKRGLGNYCFIIDMEGHIADEVVADALRVLHTELAALKFLGSYPIDSHEGPATRLKVDAAWREAEEWMESLRSQIRPV
jgi:prephenate dehydratase